MALGPASGAEKGFLLSGHNASFIPDAVWIGPAVAWYTSAAGVVNGMAQAPVLPVGAAPIGRFGSSMPRRAEV
jgi:hypothetical protein